MSVDGWQQAVKPSERWRRPATHLHPRGHGHGSSLLRLRIHPRGCGHGSSPLRLRTPRPNAKAWMAARGLGLGWSPPAEPQAKRQRMKGNSGSRAWLEPSASAEAHASDQCPVSSERHLHLDLVSLMLATDEANHLTKYAHNGMDSARVKDVLKKPCPCTDHSRCRAQQLPMTSVMEYCQRFHHLSEECQIHLIATSYETCGPAREDMATRTQWHLLGVPVCVASLAAVLGGASCRARLGHG